LNQHNDQYLSSSLSHSTNPSISIVPLILLRASGFIFGFAPPPRVETQGYKTVALSALPPYHITDKLATASISQATVNVDMYSSVVIGFLMIQ
jgi:hypothetical protein